MIYLTPNMPFPAVSESTRDGLLAIGGNLSVKRLVEAYSKGIFPWFEREEPILWWSPDPRFVLFPERIKISKSMRSLFKNQAFEVTYNERFRVVVEKCAMIKRSGQGGSWITSSMINAYCEMFDEGFAKSVEVWQDGTLVGGLYGVDLGNGVFCGESMFSELSNASKYGLITLIKENNYKLIDCQVYTKHLESLGAEMLSRTKFLRYLHTHSSKT